MAHPGAYRGTKRQKELKRLQKQQEKREKRLQKKTGQGETEPEFLDGERPPVPPGETPPMDAEGGEGATGESET
jgi:hypothetical protein